MTAAMRLLCPACPACPVWSSVLSVNHHWKNVTHKAHINVLDRNTVFALAWTRGAAFETLLVSHCIERCQLPVNIPVVLGVKKEQMFLALRSTGDQIAVVTGDLIHLPSCQASPDMLTALVVMFGFAGSVAQVNLRSPASPYCESLTGLPVILTPVKQSCLRLHHSTCIDVGLEGASTL